LAKEIAAELRAKFDLNTRPCSIWRPPRRLASMCRHRSCWARTSWSNRNTATQEDWIADGGNGSKARITAPQHWCPLRPQ